MTNFHEERRALFLLSFLFAFPFSTLRLFSHETEGECLHILLNQVWRNQTNQKKSLRTKKSGEDSPNWKERGSTRHQDPVADSSWETDFHQDGLSAGRLTLTWHHGVRVWRSPNSSRETTPWLISILGSVYWGSFLASSCLFPHHKQIPLGLLSLPIHPFLQIGHHVDALDSDKECIFRVDSSLSPVRGPIRS